jgi:pSer/pThr/pTyr-binding forkhead associated (FHA) protein
MLPVCSPRLKTTLEDLGSKNGTQVNGQRVTQLITLKDNDQIQVGSVTMTYRILDTLPSTVTRRV